MYTDGPDRSPKASAPPDALTALHSCAGKGLDSSWPDAMWSWLAPNYARPLGAKISSSLSSLKSLAQASLEARPLWPEVVMCFHHSCGSATECWGGADQMRRQRVFRAFASSFAIELMTALCTIAGSFLEPTAHMIFLFQMKLERLVSFFL